MDINKAKAQILKNVEKLNESDCGLIFSFEEQKDCIELTNKGKTNESCSYGVFSFILFAEDYASKESMYDAACKMTELLIAGTRLLDKKSYHYWKEVA